MIFRVKADIVLRNLNVGHATPQYVAWLNNYEIRRYLGLRHRPMPFTEKDIEEFLLECNLNQRFHWGIFVDGFHVGNVSCSEWSNENRWIDISYIIGDKGAQGRGVATLAVASAMRYLFEVRKFNRIQSHAVVENCASIRVMEKLNMIRDGLLRESAYFPVEDRYSDEVIYSALREEWNPELAYINTVKVEPMVWEIVGKGTEE